VWLMASVVSDIWRSSRNDPSSAPLIATSAPTNVATVRGSLRNALNCSSETKLSAKSTSRRSMSGAPLLLGFGRHRHHVRIGGDTGEGDPVAAALLVKPQHTAPWRKDEAHDNDQEGGNDHQ